jgi:hypothetical protein
MTSGTENSAATSAPELLRAVGVWAAALRDLASPGSAVRRELDHLCAGIAHAVIPRDRPAEPVPSRPGNPAAQAILPALLDAAFPPSIAPVAAALRAVWPTLDWHYGYPDRNDIPDAAASIAFADLLGPDAPLQADGIKAGFTLIGPGVLYPSHAHPAVEVYAVMAGRAEWTQSGRSAWHDPGAVILHTADEPHAMRTDAQPLLALWSWSGDIATPPRWV